MKLFLNLLALLPTASFAELKLIPLDNFQGELCYVRVYSKEHLAKHPRQKIKGAAVTITRNDGTLYIKTEVKTIKDQTMFNYGFVDYQKPTSSVKAYLDSDGGSVALTQNQTDENKVQLRVLTHLHLMEDNYTTNDQIPEGTPYDSMGIQARSVDSIWNLERVRVNGSILKSCSQVLEDQL